MHHARDVRVSRRRRRSQVKEELAHWGPTLNNAQWGHENHRDRRSHHVRTDRGSNIHPSHYGKRITKPFTPVKVDPLFRLLF